MTNERLVADHHVGRNRASLRSRGGAVAQVGLARRRILGLSARVRRRQQGQAGNRQGPRTDARTAEQTRQVTRKGHGWQRNGKALSSSTKSSTSASLSASASRFRLTALAASRPAA